MRRGEGPEAASSWEAVAPWASAPINLPPSHRATPLAPAPRAPCRRRERRARELLAAATEAVTRTRDPALAALPAAPSVANVYAWLGSDGAVRPGGKMLLAYNCGSGPLAYTNTAKLHLGVDGWKDKQKTVRGLGTWQRR